MAYESKFKETQSDEEDYSDTENAKKHDWEFDSDWKENTKKIILTVNDTITKRKWQKELGKMHYANPSKEYDKMIKVINDETVEFKCYLGKKNANLMVVFSKNGKSIYEWAFDECK